LLAPFELSGSGSTPGFAAGWPDTSKDWMVDALMKRIEWSVAVGDRLAASRAPLVTADKRSGRAVRNTPRTLCIARPALAGTVHPAAQSGIQRR